MQTPLLPVLGFLILQAATPSQPPPAAAQAPKKPAQTAGTAGRDAPLARPTVTVTVTDLEGQPISDVRVRATGPVDREAITDANGGVTLRSMNAGTYRLRFEHDGFITLEREVTHGARALKLNIALNAAPAKPVPAVEPPPDPVAAAPARPVPTAGPPTFVSIPDFFEKNYKGQASLVSDVGCVPGASSRLLQFREPLAEHVHAENDELLYVVAGEGTHKLKGQEIPLEAGLFATVPRGTPHSIVRKGRNPLVILSIVTEPCQPK
jgi:mannose-6-phosphate isomerase-like protein (cupin superfamily)